MSKRWKVLFAGTPEFAVPSLRVLLEHPQFEVVAVLTQKPKPHGRGLQMQDSPVAQLAREHDVFTLTPDSLKSPEVIATLRPLHADVAVVVAYGLLIPASALSLFPHGWVNTHASLLPRWRGASPIQHALLAGDAETGVTLMRIDAGMDTGPTFAQVRVPILADATAMSLNTELSTWSARLLTEHLGPYLEAKRPLQPQPSTGVTTARKISRADGLLQFHRPAVELERMVRAFTPWPSATFRWNGKDIKVLSATVAPGTLPAGKTQSNPQGFAIGTTKDILVIQRLQYPGKLPVDAHAFVRGYPAILHATLA